MDGGAAPVTAQDVFRVQVETTDDPLVVLVSVWYADGSLAAARVSLAGLQGQHTIGVSASGHIGVDVTAPVWSTTAILPAGLQRVTPAQMPALVRRRDRAVR
jgi:hypothetical protein